MGSIVILTICFLILSLSRNKVTYTISLIDKPIDNNNDIINQESITTKKILEDDWWL